jgi:hypothetical protein
MMTLFNKESRHCIVDECKKRYMSSLCKRITTMPWKLGSNVRVCSIYLKPRSWWARGTCPMHPSSTLKASNICGTDDAKVRAGQQKQKKKES